MNPKQLFAAFIMLSITAFVGCDKDPISTGNSGQQPQLLLKRISEEEANTLRLNQNIIKVAGGTQPNPGVFWFNWNYQNGYQTAGYKLLPGVSLYLHHHFYASTPIYTPTQLIPLLNILGANTNITLNEIPFVDQDTSVYSYLSMYGYTYRNGNFDPFPSDYDVPLYDDRTMGLDYSSATFTISNSDSIEDYSTTLSLNAAFTFENIDTTKPFVTSNDMLIHLSRKIPANSLIMFHAARPLVEVVRIIPYQLTQESEYIALSKSEVQYIFQEIKEFYNPNNDPELNKFLIVIEVKELTYRGEIVLKNRISKQEYKNDFLQGISVSTPLYLQK